MPGNSVTRKPGREDWIFKLDRESKDESLGTICVGVAAGVPACRLRHVGIAGRNACRYVATSDVLFSIQIRCLVPGFRVSCSLSLTPMFSMITKNLSASTALEFEVLRFLGRLGSGFWSVLLHRGTVALLALAGAVSAADYPGAEWPRARFAEVGLSEARLQQARDYALTGGGSGVIIRRGKIVMEWGDPAKLYDLKSSSKSIGVTALGIALKDGKVKLDDPAIKYQPALGETPESNKATGWLPK